MRELRSTLSRHGLAIDHQRKVVKRTLGESLISSGGQTFTICGDFGLVCGVYVVPDTSLSWTEKAMSEVQERHESADVPIPQFYTQTVPAAMVFYIQPPLVVEELVPQVPCLGGPLHSK